MADIKEEANRVKDQFNNTPVITRNRIILGVVVVLVVAAYFFFKG